MSTERKVVLGLIVLVFILGIVWIKGAFAFPHEPTGFRKCPWGTPVEELTFKIKKFKSMPEIKVDLYKVIEGTPTGIQEMIIVLDGKLAGMSAKMSDEKTIRLMLEAMVSMFGPPTHKTEMSIGWMGETAVVEFLPYEGAFIIGSKSGMNSVEALLEWYNARNPKQSL